MAVSTTPPTGWASKISHAVALVLLAASATMNTAYGWSKGDTLATQCVWAAIAAGSAIIFTLAWPALSKAIENRNWSAAAVAFVGLLLFGAYNVSAALGSAAGARTNATSVEADTTDARQKAQASYNIAKAELDTLKASRPVAELEPLVETARPVCRIVVTIGSRETVCAKPPALVAELGRAKRRAQLEATMAKATTDLAANKTAKAANSDARALATYLTGLGIEVTEDRMNKLLVLLAVLLVECGAGISATIGVALTPDSRRVEIVHPVPLDTGRPERAPAVPSSDPDTQAQHRTDSRTLPSVRTAFASPLMAQPSGVQDWLAGQGGRAVISMRRLASVLGRSPSAVHDELRRLQASGALTLAPGPRGTAIVLRPN